MYIQNRYGSSSSSDVIVEKMKQIQPDFSSCGIYDAAFALSIILNKNPSDISYSLDIKLMRKQFF